MKILLFVSLGLESIENVVIGDINNKILFQSYSPSEQNKAEISEIIENATEVISYRKTELRALCVTIGLTLTKEIKTTSLEEILARQLPQPPLQSGNCKYSFEECITLLGYKYERSNLCSFLRVLNDCYRKIYKNEIYQYTQGPLQIIIKENLKEKFNELFGIRDNSFNEEKCRIVNEEFQYYKIVNKHKARAFFKRGIEEYIKENPGEVLYGKIEYIRYCGGEIDEFFKEQVKGFFSNLSDKYIFKLAVIKVDKKEGEDIIPTIEYIIVKAFS